MHPPADNNLLNNIAPHARQSYAACVAGECASHWWTAVIITASNQRQAERYEAEIRRRRESGHVPAGVTYLVVPDLDDARIGSGGATLNALRMLAEHSMHGVASLEEWWAQQRVFIIHSGGDSRRLPQYSLSGKLFSALPVKTPWGGVSAVFDEMLALSTAWVEKMDSGLVVASGDVILTFDAEELHWDTPGVRGVAMREPVAVGSKHGVYITDEQGRVYSFLQKPTAAQVSDAGGMLPGDEVALDTGLIRFDATIAARLSALAGVDAQHGKVTDGILARTAAGRPNIDLYEHMTLALTGQWAPAEGAEDYWLQLADALRGVPFWCDCVAGEFTHIGSTTLFRKLMTEETNFTRLYEAQQRLGNITIPGLHSTGVVVDSVFAGGGELGSGSIAIECSLRVPIHAERGAILHGLSDLPLPVHIPADTVVHQIPIALPDGRHGVIIRVYAVDDDPKGTVTEGATWLGIPFLEQLQTLGVKPEQVWPDVAAAERTLWNADLTHWGASPMPGTAHAGSWAIKQPTVSKNGR